MISFHGIVSLEVAQYVRNSIELLLVDEIDSGILPRAMFEIADQYDYCMVLPMNNENYLTKKGKGIWSHE